MHEIHQPSSSHGEKKPLITLDFQPDFPNEDLTENNALYLRYLLADEPGVIARANEIAPHQRHIHALADSAMRLLNITTNYDPSELAAFSHGFASFETMNDLVHQPRIYDIKPAHARIAALFVDTRSLLEIETEELLSAVAEERDIQPVSHDKLAPEVDLANRHSILPDYFPNTYDVVIALGEARDETPEQLQMRAAGAQIAHSLQCTDF